jgi:hypothetical protein
MALVSSLNDLKQQSEFGQQRGKAEQMQRTAGMRTYGAEDMGVLRKAPVVGALVQK